MSVYINDQSANYPVFFHRNNKETAHKMLDSLLSNLKEFLEDLTRFENDILALPFLEEQRVTIKPIECDAMIKIIRDMQCSVESQASQLRRVNDIAVMGTFNRYDLLMNLYVIKDRSKKLTRQAMQFRSLCLNRNGDTQRARMAIQKELSYLLRQVGKTKKETGKVMETIFQEDPPRS